MLEDYLKAGFSEEEAAKLHELGIDAWKAGILLALGQTPDEIITELGGLLLRSKAAIEARLREWEKQQ